MNKKERKIAKEALKSMKRAIGRLNSPVEKVILSKDRTVYKRNQKHKQYFIYKEKQYDTSNNTIHAYYEHSSCSILRN
jgi:hypothetical protein